MDKIIILFLFSESLVLISSSSLQLKPSSKEEQLESFLKLTLPFLKQNFINRQELDSVYKLLANSNEENVPERAEQKKTSKIVADVGPFESVKRKLDDYGHLRFGRNEPQSQQSSRVKYNDPDYGHMRFG